MIVGQVSSLWRYPVKSMRGEELDEAFLGFGGVRGDRLFAFHSSRARPDFPYLTAREEPAMLLYQACWLEGAAPGGSSPVFVASPSGAEFAIHDPQLISLLSRNFRDGEKLTLLQSEQAMADCHPISLFSIQTARQLGKELNRAIDMRRFRANIFADLGTQPGFTENEFVGRNLQVGSTVVLEVIERDKRCKMITLDPETAKADPDVMRQVAREHNSTAGVYAAVLVEGVVRRGDEITLLK
jgi:uncharacterized protein